MSSKLINLTIITIIKQNGYRDLSEQHIRMKVLFDFHNYLQGYRILENILCPPT